MGAIGNVERKGVEMNSTDNKVLIQIEIDYNRLADAIAKRISGEEPVYDEDDELNTPQAAKVLGKAPSTLRGWREQGIKLTYHLNPDGEVCYKYKDLVAYKDQMKRINPKR